MVLMWASQTPELTWLFWSLQFKPLLIASVLQPMWCKREKITAFGSWGNKPCMTFLGQFFFSVPQQPNSILGLLVTEVHRLHTIRQTRGRTPLNTSEHLWTNDQPLAKTATYITLKEHKRNTSMPSAEFEPAIPAIKRLQTYALDQCFSTAGPRPGTGPWHQLYWTASDSSGIDN